MLCFSPGTAGWGGGEVVAVEQVVSVLPSHQSHSHQTAQHTILEQNQKMNPLTHAVQARIQGVGAGAGAHPWSGVSPFKMHYSIAFKYQFITGRPPLVSNPVSAPAVTVPPTTLADGPSPCCWPGAGGPGTNC